MWDMEADHRSGAIYKQRLEFTTIYNGTMDAHVAYQAMVTACAVHAVAFQVLRVHCEGVTGGAMMHATYCQLWCVDMDNSLSSKKKMMTNRNIRYVDVAKDKERIPVMDTVMYDVAC